MSPTVPGAFGCRYHCRCWSLKLRAPPALLEDWEGLSHECGYVFWRLCHECCSGSEASGLGCCGCSRSLRSRALPLLPGGLGSWMQAPLLEGLGL